MSLTFLRTFKRTSIKGNIFPGCEYAQEEDDRVVHEKDMQICISDTKWWKLGTAVAPGIALPSCLTRPCLLFVLPDARDIQNKYVAIMALDDIFWQKETKGCLKLFSALRLSTDWL